VGAYLNNPGPKHPEIVPHHPLIPAPFAIRTNEPGDHKQNRGDFNTSENRDRILENIWISITEGQVEIPSIHRNSAFEQRDQCLRVYGLPDPLATFDPQRKVLSLILRDAVQTERPQKRPFGQREQAAQNQQDEAAADSCSQPPVSSPGPIVITCPLVAKSARAGMRLGP
jgi:hypothetical protein